MMVMMNNYAHDFRSNLAPTIISTMMLIVNYDLALTYTQTAISIEITKDDDND